MQHEAGYLYIRRWACRWWNEKAWRFERIQIVFFLAVGQVNFTIGAARAREWMNDFNDTQSQGDEYHYFLYDDTKPALIMNRAKAQEFRQSLMRLLDDGPKRSPMKGYSSDDLQTKVAALNEIITPQGVRWV